MSQNFIYFVKLDYIEYDSRVKQVLVGGNRRRGRPASTKGALEFQDSDEQDDENEQSSQKTNKRGPKKALLIESEISSEESDYDIFNDDHVQKVQKSIKQKTLSNQTTVASTSQATNNTTNGKSVIAPICPKCGSQMKKKNGYYCINKCKKN